MQMYEHAGLFDKRKEINMKIKKQFLSILMVVCMCTATSTTAFAIESGPSNMGAEVVLSLTEQETYETALLEADYLNYEFPKGAVVIEQSKYGVMYYIPGEESIMSNTDTPTPYLNDGRVTIDASKNMNQSGSFTASNPGSLFKRTYGSFDVVCKNSKSTAQMMFLCGSFNTHAVQMSTGNSPWHFDFVSSKSTATINYWANCADRVNDMTLICWLWTL